MIFHIHWYSKPIVSKYVDFNNRDIIYECRCGAKKLIPTYRPYDRDFPIDTNGLITDLGFDRILKSTNKHKNLDYEK